MKINTTPADILKYGILAADERPDSLLKAFTKHTIPYNNNTAYEYRKLLFTTPYLEDVISGVILSEDIAHNDELVSLLHTRGIYTGVKIDNGLQEYCHNSIQKTTLGIDEIADKVHKYSNTGHVFTKWRAVFTVINMDMDAYAHITLEALKLAYYAKLVQQRGMIPIVEPEVLMNGMHSIDADKVYYEAVLEGVFAMLALYNIDMKRMILKPSMVLKGDMNTDIVSDEEVAKHTLHALSNHVPNDIGGVAFLSGGQSTEDAYNRLKLINKHKTVPYRCTYSFGRALHKDAMIAYNGDINNIDTAQKALYTNALRLKEAII